MKTARIRATADLILFALVILTAGGILGLVATRDLRKLGLTDRRFPWVRAAGVLGWLVAGVAWILVLHGWDLGEYSPGFIFSYVIGLFAAVSGALAIKDLLNPIGEDYGFAAHELWEESWREVLVVIVSFALAYPVWSFAEVVQALPTDQRLAALRPSVRRAYSLIENFHRERGRCVGRPSPSLRKCQCRQLGEMRYLVSEVEGILAASDADLEFDLNRGRGTGGIYDLAALRQVAAGLTCPPEP